MRMTGKRQPILRPDTNPKSYKFPFLDNSSLTSGPAGVQILWNLERKVLIDDNHIGVAAEGIVSPVHVGAIWRLGHVQTRHVDFPHAA